MALWSKTPEEGYVRRYRASHRKLPEGTLGMLILNEVPGDELGSFYPVVIRAQSLAKGNGEFIHFFKGFQGFHQTLSCEMSGAPF